MQEKVWQNLDKLLLALLFLCCMGVGAWMNVHGATMDEGSLDWARHNTDLLLAALFGLMGGRQWQRFTDKSDEGEK